MNENLAISDEKSAETDDLLQLVGFVLAGEIFGVDILSVQEIIKKTPITAIPDSPDFVEGVINLRGRIIPIIDLRKRLNLPEAARAQHSETWIMILNVGERITGFTVDRVTRVMKVPASAIQPPPEMMVSALKSQYVSGICRLSDQPMALLDFNKILVVEEFKRIAETRRQ
jgi:purine-binding chemotaxis protein CheW